MPTEPVNKQDNVAVGGHFEQNTFGTDWSPKGNAVRSDVDKSAKDGTHYAILTVPSAAAPASLSQKIVRPSSPPPRRRAELERRAVTESYQSSLWYRVKSFDRGSTSTNRCALYFGINGLDDEGPTEDRNATLFADASDVVSEWKEFTDLLEHEGSIDDFQVNLGCENDATATVEVDWVSMVPNTQLKSEYPDSSAQNINNKARRIRGAASWSLLTFSFSGQSAR